LLFGVRIRWAALDSAATLVVFAVSMFIFAGFETPLSLNPWIGDVVPSGG
jgi:hypothetical protein